jgi:hypothetical protein
MTQQKQKRSCLKQDIDKPVLSSISYDIDEEQQLKAMFLTPFLFLDEFSSR